MTVATTEPTELTNNAAEMCKRYGGLVRLLARKAHWGRLAVWSIEDLEQEGFALLVSLVNRGVHDPNKAQFSTFLSTCLENLYRHLWRQKNILPQQPPKWRERASKGDPVPFPEDLQFALWKRLSPRARIVFDCMIFQYPQTYGASALGGYFDLSAQGVNLIAREVRCKMKQLVGLSDVAVGGAE